MKYYLKCNHCAQPNEIKSEYMVLCSSCGQKLENNYTQWQRRNPGATFENYKNSVGITEDKLQSTTTPKKSKSINSGSLKKKILIAVVAVIFANLGVWLGERAIHAIRNNKKTDEKVLQEQWVKKTYGSYGLTIETPWELQPAPSPPVTQDTENVIENMENFGSNDKSDDFIINTTSIKYIPELGQVDVYGGAMGAINGLKNMPGVSDFTHTINEYAVGNLPGYILKGSYLQQRFEFEFVSLIIGKDLVAWQIMALGRKNDKVFQEMAERIINSIEIDY